MKLHKNKSAFSLIELSIVILIIGIIIAGVTKSSTLVELYRLSSARTQTQSSPVNSIENLVLWYEATSKASFVKRETDNYTDLSDAEKGLLKGRISTWYDISSATGTRNNATQDNAGAADQTDAKALRPAYKTDCINSLPCVYFDGAQNFLNFAEPGITGTNYTIFIVEKRESNGVMIGSENTETLQISYDGADSEISWGHTNDSYTTFAENSLDPDDGYAILHTFVNESFNGFVALIQDNFYHYTNGDSDSNISTHTAKGTANTVGYLPSYVAPTIGMGLSQTETEYYGGGIGEIIIYSRALQAQERDAVAAYLIKKWQIKPDNTDA